MNIGTRRRARELTGVPGPGPVGSQQRGRHEEDGDREGQPGDDQRPDGDSQTSSSGTASDAERLGAHHDGLLDPEDPAHDVIARPCAASASGSRHTTIDEPMPAKTRRPAAASPPGATATAATARAEERRRLDKRATQPLTPDEDDGNA